MNSSITNEWVTVNMGLNGLDPDSDQNKHRINLEKVQIELILLGMAGHAK
jgi:hypothetical protein